MKTLFTRYTPLQIIMHLGAWFPLARLLFDFFAGNLSANPIQDMQQRTGRAAITLLVLSLACTPLNALFGWRELIKRRRALGLYAVMYASIHLLIFINLDYGFAWSLILQTVFEKPYILIGLTTFLLLIPLAMTSFDVWKARMGRNWKRLHQLVYWTAPLAVLHYAWAKKGDLFNLTGDILRPLVYAAVVAVLLLVRIPPVRRALASARDRILFLFRGRKPAARDESTINA
jgi:sulfoxide reductase heme-binding subunit YedZ